MERFLSAPVTGTRASEVIDQALFVMAEAWDEALPAPVVQRAEDCCAG